MIIEKKIWPEFFELIKIGKKKFELRLGDFEIVEGDTLVLKEWDPKTKNFTGREIKRKVKFVRKVNPFNFWSEDEIKKFGLQIIEIGD